MKFNNWQAFDCAVARLAAALSGDFIDRNCVYGESRGGLCLAVALSHRLELPLVLEKKDITGKAIWVDDILDSGKTFEEAAGSMPPDTIFAVWHIRASQRDKHSRVVFCEIVNDEWMVYPWESAVNAKREREDYANK